MLKRGMSVFFDIWAWASGDSIVEYIDPNGSHV